MKIKNTKGKAVESVFSFLIGLLVAIALSIWVVDSIQLEEKMSMTLMNKNLGEFQYALEFADKMDYYEGSYHFPKKKNAILKINGNEICVESPEFPRVCRIAFVDELGISEYSLDNAISFRIIKDDLGYQIIES